MRIIKVFNNNSVAALSNELGDIIVTGSGVGFQKKIGDLVDENKIEKTYLFKGKDQNIVKNELAGWIGGNERKLNIKVTYNLINNSALLVKEGGGYALTFDNIIHLDEKSTLCFRPLLPRLEDGIHIAWKKYHVFSKQAELLIRL